MITSSFYSSEFVATVDLSKYSTVSFLARSASANSLVFNTVTVDESVTMQAKS